MRIPIRSAVGLLRERGIGVTTAYGLHRLSESYHEWALGIETGRQVLTLAEHSGDNIHYVPSDYATLRRTFRLLGRVAEGSVLLDYGCGMGRVLAFAGRYPFRRILGVELSPKLSSLARENIERARPRLKCSDIQVVTANATTYEVPTDVTVVYLFNPFRGDTMRAVLEHLRLSFEQSPRDMVIACKQPANLEAVRQSEWLHKWREFVCYDGHPVRLYRTHPR